MDSINSSNNVISSSNSATTTSPATTSTPPASTPNSNATNNSQPVDSFSPSEEYKSMQASAAQPRAVTASSAANSANTAVSPSASTGNGNSANPSARPAGAPASQQADADKKILTGSQSAQAWHNYSDANNRILPFQYNAGNGQTVTTLGTTHNNQPDSPVTQQLQSSLSGYFKNTPSDKQVVIVETPDVPKQRDSADATIKDSGEFGAAVVAASQQNPPAPVKSGDASMTEKAQALKAGGASTDDVGSFFAMRNLYGQQNKAPMAADKMYEKLADVSRQTGFKSDEMAKVQSLQQQKEANPDQASVLNPQIDEARQKFTSSALDAINSRSQDSIDKQLVLPQADGTYKVNANTQDFAQMNSPEGGNSAFNQLAQAEGDFRNKHYLDVLENEVKAGKSPILIAGAAHPLALDPALSSLYSRTSAPAQNDGSASGWNGYLASLFGLGK